jgi:hypothetical protein
MAPDTDFISRAAVAVRDQLATTQRLSDFLDPTRRLSRTEMIGIVRQAVWMIELAYVHLAQKRTMYAVEPLQQLRLLGYRLERAPDALLPDELTFHREMTQIFTALRDLHTNYLLPPPYRDTVAFLPFMVEACYDKASPAPQYLVSKVLPHYDRPPFGVGVVLVDWNGIPIERAIELNAAQQAGGNAAARIARGIEALTIRPMVRVLPPDEHWVTIGYRRQQGDRLELRQDWLIFTPAATSMAQESAGGADASLRLGLDLQSERIQETRKIFFAPAAVAAEQRVSARGDAPQAIAGSPETIETVLPTVFRARQQPTDSGIFGYIRIFTFVAPNGDVDGFVNEFVRLAEQLPESGLIIDVRGNGGGHIQAAERLLQTLTPRWIEPARFQFVNSPLSLALSRRYDDLGIWAPSIAQSVETGALFSLGFPLTDQRVANAIGQRYCGPVVLITDAICYSATDMFAAGFCDHAIGAVLGTSENTGAGGANVWPYSYLRALANLTDLGPIAALPAGVEMRVAIRRSVRVGANGGVTLEDLGITPNALHHMTRRDLLENNDDLLNAAGRLLSEQSVYRLEIARQTRTARRLEVTVRSAGIDRLDVLVNGRPGQSVDISSEETTLHIRLASVRSGTVRLLGWAAGVLVISRAIGGL